MDSYIGCNHMKHTLEIFKSKFNCRKREANLERKFKLKKLKIK